MALPKKQKFIFLIIAVSIGLLAWGIPQLFWKKPPMEQNENVIQAEREINIIIEIIEQFKKEKGEYPNSIEPILNLSDFAFLKEDFENLQAKYTYLTPSNSFEISFKLTNPDSINGLWSSEKKSWTLIQP